MASGGYYSTSESRGVFIVDQRPLFDFVALRVQQEHGINNTSTLNCSWHMFNRRVLQFFFQMLQGKKPWMVFKVLQRRSAIREQECVKIFGL